MRRSIGPFHNISCARCCVFVPVLGLSVCEYRYANEHIMCTICYWICWCQVLEPKCHMTLLCATTHVAPYEHTAGDCTQQLHIQTHISSHDASSVNTNLLMLISFPCKLTKDDFLNPNGSLCMLTQKLVFPHPMLGGICV